MFPFTQLPLEITIQILEYAIQAPASYRSICLTNTAAGDVIHDYAISVMVVSISGLNSATRFKHFLMIYPKIAPRIRHIRVYHCISSYTDEHTQLVIDTLRRCVNIQTLSINTHMLDSFPATVVIPKLRMLHLNCLDNESTGEAVLRHNPLLGQITHLYGTFTYDMSFKTLTTNVVFANLTHFASPSCFPYEDTHEELEILSDRSIFPTLQIVVFEVDPPSLRRCIDLGLTRKGYQLWVLTQAKKWPWLYLYFNSSPSRPSHLDLSPESQEWIDRGEKFWSQALRLTDDHEMPTFWPNLDVRELFRSSKSSAGNG